MSLETALVQQGQVLAGKYRVERVLGQGGMGVVLAARHVHLEEPVAVKLMLSEAAFNSEAVARFLREARAAARLESAHVARVSDVGTLEDGRPYMVMEYLDGSDLSQVLARTGPLAVSDVVDYVLQAGEALAEAHSIGIVHRDLKPSNLFLTRRRDRTPHIKVLDFGISKVSGPPGSGADNAMTKTSAMMGSPLYMSPEQMTSVRDVDGRSDIWALGIIMYELLSGSPPFIAETLPQVCGLVLQSQPAPPSSRRPDLPPELEAVIMRCLEKSANDRYQNVAELAVALSNLAGRYGRASVDRILMLSGAEQPASAASPHLTSSSDAPSPAATAARGTHAAWGETKPPVAKRRSSALVLVGLLGAVPVLAGAAWWGLHRSQADGPTPESSVTVVSGAEPASLVPSVATLAPSPPTPSAAPAEAPSAAAPSPAPSALSSVTPKKQTPVVAAKPVSKPNPAAAVVAATPAPAAPVLKPATAKSASEVKKPSGMGGRL